MARQFGAGALSDIGWIRVLADLLVDEGIARAKLPVGGDRALDFQIDALGSDQPRRPVATGGRIRRADVLIGQDHGEFFLIDPENGSTRV
jgi:hypothetical protein